MGVFLWGGILEKTTCRGYTKRSTFEWTVRFSNHFSWNLFLYRASSFLCPFNLDLFPRLPYNVGMKDKELKIKVDDQFIEKVDYLQKINDFKNRSDTVRKVVEKEYRKETVFQTEELESKGLEWEYTFTPFEGRYPRSEQICKGCPHLNTYDCRIYGKGWGDEIGCTHDKEKEDGR